MASTLFFLSFLSVFVNFCVLAPATLTVPSHHDWEVNIVLIEDGMNQHPGTSVHSKEAYYQEVFLSVSRRLQLLHIGTFYFMRKGFLTLSHEESQALFVRTGRPANINEVFLQWKSTLAKKYRRHTAGKDLVILLTRRTITAPNGAGGSGFALKGSLCTPDNLVLVKDDGSFLAVNTLVKVFLNSMGIDVDGVGAAGSCRNDEGHLMGTDLHLPLTFSECTMRQLPEAIRKLTCLRKIASSKSAKTLPIPPLISRVAYCSALSLGHCDKLGMGTLAGLTYQEKFCFVFCCRGFAPLKKMVAPDGLQCGKDVTGLVDRRCINGECVQVS
ncbi:uncharacterized protein LOC142587412 isoform X2 [Dermacentor variabilis]|uniref:uncharacterized protein LOC142587412 isoform X2 n=2 Tax=Dermacentor variabilis TaxID=34621 RepID=UPI003F5B180E